ncbi:hypothetical protein [Rhizobium sp.]
MNDINTTRRSLLFSGAALAGLFAVPLVPAGLGNGLTTFGSALARKGADDGPNDDGNHTGADDSGHHGKDGSDDHPGGHGGRHKNGDKDRGKNKGRGKNRGGNHGSDHT